MCRTSPVLTIRGDRPFLACRARVVGGRIHTGPSDGLHPSGRPLFTCLLRTGASQHRPQAEAGRPDGGARSTARLVNLDRGDLTRVSIPLLNQAWKAPGLDSTTAFVLVSLADQANDEGVCWPSYSSLARRVRRDPSTVGRALNRLEERGYITRVQGHTGRNNRYQVHPTRGTVHLVQETPSAQRTSNLVQGAPGPSAGGTSNHQLTPIKPSPSRGATSRASTNVEDEIEIASGGSSPLRGGYDNKRGGPPSFLDNYGNEIPVDQTELVEEEEFPW